MVAVSVIGSPSKPPCAPEVNMFHRAPRPRRTNCFRDSAFYRKLHVPIKTPLPRPDGRLPDQLRPISFTPGIAPHATGSVLVAFGDTRVICAATIEEGVPRWMKEQGVPGGWITAEYSMLPYSTIGRKARD